MKSTVLFIILIFSGIASWAQTYVSGGIYVNTTWTKTGSPYIVVGDVAVFETYTLTIEPGVEVRFRDGKMLDIRGNLIANGTKADSIKFTSDSAAPAAGSWQYIQFEYRSKASFSYCTIEYSSKGIYYNSGSFSTYRFSHCRFSYNFEGISSNELYGAQRVDSSVFSYNTYGINSTSMENDTVTHSSFFGNKYGIESAGFSSISHCDFHDNSVVGLSGGSSSLRHCSFFNNETGLQFCFGGGTEAGSMISDSITNNNIGLVICGGTPYAICRFNWIYNNSTWNVKNTSQYSGADLRDNCWGSTDSAFIESKIYDGKDDITVGLVYFMPFLTNCDSILGVNKHLEPEAHELFPNPSNGIIRLSGMDKAFTYEILSCNSTLIRKGAVSYTHLTLPTNREV